MGTNYYAVKNRPSIHGGLHIGKMSAGWLFLFHQVNDSWSDPEVHWNSFDEVCDWLRHYVYETEEYVIMDEYDRIVDLDEFLGMIQDRQHDLRCSYNPHNFDHAKNIGGYRFTEGEFR